MRNKDVLVAMGGFAAGAGVLFWLDPRSGARRRAKVGHQATHASRQAGDAAGKTARDLANRAKGLLAALGAWRERAVDDVVLAEPRLCARATPRTMRAR
ncbi:MAG: hypothetical protein E6J64_22790 [Deltaproteobacteria bacterium]|nr:MAG: hypothetical protein E6J64_22790 [Deltaproteobacteria bacterium]